MKRELLTQILAAKAALKPLAVVTALDDSTGQQWAVTASDDGESPAEAPALTTELLATARQMLHDDRSGTIADSDNRRFFIQSYNPPLRLLVVGAVHIAQALLPLARQLGYQVTLIDPRQAWATASRFPDTALLDAWPDDALTQLKPDSRSAIVTLSHDPKLDDPALAVALRSAAFYIGSLGSKKTHQARLDRLRQAGFDAAALSRIHGPVGLPIGARSPAEIALAIMAEITQTLHQAPKVNL